MKTVEINNLVKSYSGKKAVDDLSFSVIPGEIMGLIGPNGAGKSTTIKTILGFVQPDSGSVKVFGNSLKEEVKNRIGYLPEERGVYKKLSAIDLIVYLATLKGMNSHTAEKNADVRPAEIGRPRQGLPVRRENEELRPSDATGEGDSGGLARDPASDGTDAGAEAVQGIAGRLHEPRHGRSEFRRELHLPGTRKPGGRPVLLSQHRLPGDGRPGNRRKGVDDRG